MSIETEICSEPDLRRERETFLCATMNGESSEMAMTDAKRVIMERMARRMRGTQMLVSIWENSRVSTAVEQGEEEMKTN